MFFKIKPHPISEALLKSIKEHPEKWFAGEHTIYIGNKQEHLAGIRIWTANGYEHLKLYEPYRKYFPRYWKKKIWRAIQEWRDLPVSVNSFLELLAACEAATV